MSSDEYSSTDDERRAPPPPPGRYGSSRASRSHDDSGDAPNDYNNQFETLEEDILGASSGSDSDANPYALYMGGYGGHGMQGCGQYGFALVDSTGGAVDVHYFEEANTKAPGNGDGAYAKILECVETGGRGVVGCTDLAASWLAQNHSNATTTVLVLE